MSRQMFCGKVKFELNLPVKWCVNCHCESCRRQCSAPFTTYVGVDEGKWNWLEKTPKTYHSSPGVERTFCGDCGSSLSFKSENLTGHMFFYVACLDSPELFAPEQHVVYEEKLPWLNVAMNWQSIPGRGCDRGR